jgi:hypothetical protein
MPPFAKANTMATRSLSAVLMALAFDPASAQSTAVQRQEPTPAEVLEQRKLSQADAAKVLGVTQPKISALRHYKLAGFSVERLMNLLCPWCGS